MRKLSRRGFLGVSAASAGAAVAAKTVGFGEEPVAPIEYTDTHQGFTVTAGPDGMITSTKVYGFTEVNRYSETPGNIDDFASRAGAYYDYLIAEQKRSA